MKEMMMGTAGITHFHQGGRETPYICHVYKQSDGYPESLGEQIKASLGQATLVNGIRFGLENQVNGLGCAAATFIAYAKEGVGRVYMLNEAKDWADYDYHIFFDGDPLKPGDGARLSMEIVDGRNVIWSGKICDFDSAALYADEEDQELTP